MADHHALPDGFAERLEDIADRLEMMPFALGHGQFIEYKRELIRMLIAMSEFPHKVSEI